MVLSVYLRQSLNVSWICCSKRENKSTPFLALHYYYYYEWRDTKAESIFLRSFQRKFLIFSFSHPLGKRRPIWILFFRIIINILYFVVTTILHLQTHTYHTIQEQFWALQRMQNGDQAANIVVPPVTCSQWKLIQSGQMGHCPTNFSLLSANFHLPAFLLTTNQGSGPASQLPPP